MPIDVVILAAGQGSRMKSSLPKVLHPLAGRPMIQHLLDTVKQLNDARIHLIVGHGADQVQKALEGQKINYVFQHEQLGTGHAVAQSLPSLGDGPVLMLNGDAPLLSLKTLERLSKGLDSDQLTLLSVMQDDPTGYGRIVRNAEKQVVAIVEQKDASPEQLAIHECNTGLMATTGRLLKEWLPRLKPENAQGEYYLTDIVGMAHQDGTSLTAIQAECVEEVSGVNDRRQLSVLERWYQQRQADRAMADGATLVDPSRFDQRGTLTLGRDVFIDVGCIFEGDVILEDNVHIGPYCVIRHSHIGAGSHIDAYSHIDNARAEGDNRVGPFARLRPAAHLERSAHIGNFVEIKKATIGTETKVNHLSYIGDAKVGKGTNIGAGSITCNYDGVNKHVTEIGDRAFIGSNSVMVAPISIGNDSFVAAGSTLTDSVGDGVLAIGRSRQVVKEGWKRPGDE